jgi:hypothetical protein
VHAAVVEDEGGRPGQLTARVDRGRVGHVGDPPPHTRRVERAIYAEVPPRVEDTLTEAGRRLEPVLAALADWGRPAPVH